MRSIYKTLLEPENGNKYNNVKTVGDKKYIVNSVINEQDFRYTNRIGVVKHPARTNNILEKGDRVVVHHNIFRKFNNIRGELVDSGSFIREGEYACFDDQIFAYQRNGEWNSLDRFCFVTPVKREDKMITTLKKKDNFLGREDLVGHVFINNPELEKQGLKLGDKVLFKPNSEYEFNIDGVVCYRVLYASIIAEILDNER